MSNPEPHDTASPEDQKKRRAVIAGAVAGCLLLALTVYFFMNDPASSRTNVENFHVLNEASNRRTKGDFVRALAFLERLHELNSKQAQEKVLYYLRKWVREEEPNANWIADPMANQLPQEYRQFVETSTLSKKEIEPFDVQVLREATWFRDAAKTATQKSKTPPDVLKLIEEAKPFVKPEQQRDLATATILFDWVVRNIQTDAEPTGKDTDRYGSDVILHAGEALMFGHGTFREKSRVFLMLARQLGLEVVMLGIEQDRDVPRDWLPALKVGNDLFLFEMKLGTPVPRVDGLGIATLEHLMEHPQVLRTFDLQGKIYSLGPESLKRVVAMIDATPAYLSERMANIEAAMSGGSKLVLTSRPSLMKTELRNCKGITSIMIWTLPYEAFVRRQKLKDNPSGMAALNFENFFFFDSTIDDSNNAFSRGTSDRNRIVDRRVSLNQGRILQFRGRFVDDGAARGASSHFMGLRKPKAAITAIDQFEITKAQRVQAKLIATTNKLHASYWLGVMALDRGLYQNAINTFKKRNLEDFPDGPWTAGAKYNLGRAYEALAAEVNDPSYVKLAIEAYRSDRDSPQSPQSALRARRLETIQTPIPNRTELEQEPAEATE